MITFVISNFLIFSIDATFSERKGKYVNDEESSKANARMRLMNIDEEPVLALFAKRHINQDKEICFDYGVKNLPWRQKRGTLKKKYLHTHHLEVNDKKRQK